MATTAATMKAITASRNVTTTGSRTAEGVLHSIFSADHTSAGEDSSRGLTAPEAVSASHATSTATTTAR
jgi:hypothetical protein